MKTFPEETWGWDLLMNVRFFMTKRGVLVQIGWRLFKRWTSLELVTCQRQEKKVGGHHTKKNDLKKPKLEEKGKP